MVNVDPLCIAFIRQEHRFAVAGGTTEKPDSVEGLAILGDNVCAASIVIPESVTEKDDFVECATKVINLVFIICLASIFLPLISILFIWVYLMGHSFEFCKLCVNAYKIL